MITRHKYLRPMLLLLLLLAAVLSFSGCSSSDASPSLWVVTEESNDDGMTRLVRQVVNAFQADHPDVAVTLDVLPTGGSQRETVVKQLRTKIMAGNGPDVFLLPSCDAYRYNLTTWYPSEILTLSNRIEPLFSDPLQTMYRGAFMDISRFYDSDTDLRTEQLQPDVMEAGTLDGGRYLLPLYYDFPVLYADTEGMQSMGLELDGRWGNLVEAALAQGNPLLASNAKPDFCQLGSAFTLLPDTLNYENDTVALTEADFFSFLTRYQALLTLADGQDSDPYGPSMDNWANHSWIQITEPDGSFHTDDTEMFPNKIPVLVSTLSQAPIAAAIAKAARREEVQMIPLTGDDGALTATVIYYGALGAGCRNPALGYDLLLRFLLEENQWELTRPTYPDPLDRPYPQQYHPIVNGWPVRNHGWLNSQWLYYRNTQRMFIGGSNRNAAGNRRLRLLRVDLTEDDIPILDVKIDRVSFGNTLEQEIATLLRQLRDGEAGDADLEAQAAQFLRELRWQITEG